MTLCNDMNRLEQALDAVSERLEQNEDIYECLGSIDDDLVSATEAAAAEEEHRFATGSRTNIIAPHSIISVHEWKATQGWGLVGAVQRFCEEQAVLEQLLEEELDDYHAFLGASPLNPDEFSR